MDYPIRTMQQLRPLLLGFRKRAGLSQTGVAALLGVTQQSYAKIEANPGSTSVERLFTILRLLGSEIVLTERQERDQEGAEDAAPVPVSADRTKKGRAAAPPKVTPPSKTTERW